MKILFIYFLIIGSLLSSPLTLIHSLGDELKPAEREVLKVLVRKHIAENNVQLENLKLKISLGRGGKIINQIKFKEKILDEIYYLEKENEELQKFF